MATRLSEITTTTINRDNEFKTLFLNAFHGGTANGPCVALSIGAVAYVELTRNDVVKLRDTLTQWLETRFLVGCIRD